MKNPLRILIVFLVMAGIHILCFDLSRKIISGFYCEWVRCFDPYQFDHEENWYLGLTNIFLIGFLIMYSKTISANQAVLISLLILLPDYLILLAIIGKDSLMIDRCPLFLPLLLVPLNFFSLWIAHKMVQPVQQIPQ